MNRNVLEAINIDKPRRGLIIVTRRLTTKINPRRGFIKEFVNNMVSRITKLSHIMY